MFFDKIYLDNFLFMQKKKKSSLGKIIVNTRLVLPSVYISSKIANADGLKQRFSKLWPVGHISLLLGFVWLLRLESFYTSQ